VCVFQTGALEMGDKLTLDDVPPKSALRTGPRLLVLTCKQCNDRSGSEVDHHLAELERSRRFGQAEEGSRLFGRMTLGGETLNTPLSWERDGSGQNRLGMIGWAPHNPPQKVERAKEYLERVATEGHSDWSFTLSIDTTVGLWRAQVSVLRSAFLATFAWLGYSWAFHRNLLLVRRQLRDPSAKLIPRFPGLRLGDHESERALGLIHEPHWLRGVIVQMGPYQVLLPFNESAESFYGRLAERLDGEFASGAESWDLRLDCGRREWPQLPELRIDYGISLGRALPWPGDQASRGLWGADELGEEE
jgi:hypothetical protein